jgi:hypothetical protein
MTYNRLDPDAARAEVAYLRQRKQELLQDFNHVLGTSYASAAEAVQQADASPSGAEYARELRDRGNLSLADRWVAADLAWDASQRGLEALNEREEREVRAVPIEEWTRARDAMNDALEVLERLIAEARGWLGEQGIRAVE